MWYLVLQYLGMLFYHSVLYKKVILNLGCAFLKSVKLETLSSYSDGEYEYFYKNNEIIQWHKDFGGVGNFDRNFGRNFRLSPKK